MTFNIAPYKQYSGNWDYKHS